MDAVPAPRPRALRHRGDAHGARDARDPRRGAGLRGRFALAAVRARSRSLAAARAGFGWAVDLREARGGGGDRGADPAPGHGDTRGRVSDRARRLAADRGPRPAGAGPGAGARAVEWG